MPVANPLPDQTTLINLFDYDALDGELLWVATGAKAGSKHHSGYVSVQINNRRYQAHRIIWAMHYGRVPENKLIDHIDGDRANNRMSNLRLVSDSENQYNRTANKGREFKGVYPYKRQWKAEITANKRRVYLGLFSTPELASEAYKKAATELHGKHARF